MIDADPVCRSMSLGGRVTMQSRRLVRRSILAGVLFATVGSVAFAQAVKDKRVQKLVEEEQQAILKLVDGLEPGAPLPSDYALRLSWDSFKAGEKQTFLPVTVAFTAKEASAEVAVLLNIVEARMDIPSQKEM